MKNPRLLLALIALAMLEVASAQTQIPLPAFDRTYTATQTRGFHFVAPADFTIISVNVANETGAPFQHVNVARYGSPIPAFSGSAVGTELFHATGASSATPISTSVPITSGDILSVLGACGTTASGTTMRNSYASPGPFASTIDGMPVTLARALHQGALTAGSSPFAVSTENASPIARVEVVYTVGGGPPPPGAPASSATALILTALMMLLGMSVVTMGRKSA